MTNDLIARILAAIDKTEAAITQYRDHRAGADPCINYEGQAPEHYTEWDSCWRHIVTAEATPYSDVEFGLRHCAAERKIIEQLWTDVLQHGEDYWETRSTWDVAVAVLVGLADAYDITIEASPPSNG